MALEKFFNPKSVAVIGATEDPGNITSAVITNLIEMKFAGKILATAFERAEIRKDQDALMEAYLLGTSF